jgi:hypothetical protein
MNVNWYFRIIKLKLNVCNKRKNIYIIENTEVKFVYLYSFNKILIFFIHCDQICNFITSYTTPILEV